jgi:hypothetical protein
MNDWQPVLADLLTRLWRLRSRLFPPAGAVRSEEDIRRACRELAALWDKLPDDGLEIIDHTAEAYDPSQSLKVLAFQPLADLTRDVVVETIKPTVYFRQQRLQTGEVIVGTPETDASVPPSGPHG